MFNICSYSFLSAELVHIKLIGIDFIQIFLLDSHVNYKSQTGHLRNIFVNKIVSMFVFLRKNGASYLVLTRILQLIIPNKELCF